MRKRFHHGMTRMLARVLLPACALLFLAPPAVADPRPRWRPTRTQTPDAKLRAKIAAHEAARPDVRELSEKEMSALYGRGPYRNRAFSGVLPWQRSLRDVNLNNGNLFKSFTDIQVAPARGAGLAFQRSYNSNDERVGPFGVGWTHAYDIRVEEAGNNIVERVDFFGGEHRYTRDADGLYSPPAYLHDELSSEYLNTLVNGPAEVATDEQRGMDGTVKHFFANGSERCLDYIEDRHGNRTVLTYGLSIGGKNLLTRVTDPSGRYLEITWTNLNLGGQPTWRITQVQGPFQPGSGLPVYTVAYEYNGEGNLWKVRQDPSGLNRIVTYTYATVSGESGLLASITDPLGHAVSYTYALPQYNFTGTVWVSTATSPGSGGNEVFTFTPQVPGQQPWPFSTQVTSNVGVGCGFAMDNQMRAAFTGIGGPYAYLPEYDSSNNVTSVHQASLIYLPGGYYENIPTRKQVMTYGPHGNVITAGWDGFPNSTTTTSYFNASKYFQKASVTDPNGNITLLDYFEKSDPNPGNRGQVKWVRDARYSVTGEQFDYTYNQYGQKLTEINLNNVPTHYTYGDTWGNLTQVVQDPGTGKLNRTTGMAYDVAGRVVSSTDPKGQPSSFTYNAVGQPLQAILPGETISYGYGANGRTETVIDGRGTTTIAYESGNDRVQSVTDPVTGVVGYTYNLGGQRLYMTLPGGGTWLYEYEERSMLPQDDPNSLTRPLKKITDDQGRPVHYYWDQYGALHLSRTNQTFDGGGNLLTYLDTRYTQDADTAGTRGRGLIKQVHNTWNFKNAMGQWQQTTLVKNDYGYDNAGQRLTNTLSDSTGPIRTEQYGYDPLSRLTSVNYGDGQTQGYTFDAMGNRLTKTDSAAGNDTYTFNAANMLLTRNGGAYTNDLNGNTLTGGGRTNTWDGQNRLTQCVNGATSTNHTYGADGLRRRTVQGANTTDYVLEGQSVVRTLLNGTVDKTFLQGARGPEYERLGANDPVWYLYDGLGSVLGTVDKNGNVVSTRKFDVYGAVRSSTGPSGPKHKFVGALGHPSEDETGLVYMRARHYDPQIGRFASEDPAYHGVNWFVYVSNNPANQVDSSGTTGNGINDMFGAAGWLHGLVDKFSPAHWLSKVIEKLSLPHLSANERESYLRSLGAAAKKGPKGPKGLPLSSLDAYFFTDPLDFMAIWLDASGMHDEAQFIDRLNGN